MEEKTIYIFLIIILFCRSNKAIPCEYDHRKTQSTEEFPHVMNMIKCGDDIGNGNDVVTMGYIPGGNGLFRDSMDVLGPKFLSSYMVSLCELRMYTEGGIISDVKFTKKGSRLCCEVCDQYHKNMIFDGPVDANLMQGYCDYTGVTDHRADCDEPNLSATCTCAFKVRCNRRTKMIMYTFQVNCSGFLRVSVSETDKTQCIT